MRRGRGRGFTLIEVLVALTIISLLTTMLWGFFSQTMGTKTHVEAAHDRYQAVRVALNRMAREIAMAFIVKAAPPTEVRTFDTIFRGWPEGRTYRLDFTAFAHVRLHKDVHESDQCEISYFVGPDPDLPYVTHLFRREDPDLDLDPERGGTVQVLAEYVTGFKLLFYDPQDEEWREDWDTTEAIGQVDRLPRAVRIELSFLDERGVEVTLSTIARVHLEKTVCDER